MSPGAAYLQYLEDRSDRNEPLESLSAVGLHPLAVAAAADLPIPLLS